MGNCLVVREKVIKIMKPDGKILEYRAPMKVYQVLTDFSGYAISETASVMKHLRPETKLVGGHLYYLVSLPLPSKGAAKKKKVRFSDPEVKEEEEAADDYQQESNKTMTEAADDYQQESNKTTTSSVVRIKLVISKQELQEMLRKGGVSVGDMVSQFQSSEKSLDCGGWKPVLERIPEGN